MVLVISTRDVMGTAHSNAYAAANRIRDAFVDKDEPPAGSELERIEFLLNKALSDIGLVRHMTDGTWKDSVYTNKWEIDKE